MKYIIVFAILCVLTIAFLLVRRNNKQRVDAYLDQAGDKLDSAIDKAKEEVKKK